MSSSSSSSLKKRNLGIDNPAASIYPEITEKINPPEYEEKPKYNRVNSKVAKGMEISFQNLSVHVETKKKRKVQQKVIIDNITGVVKPGQMVSIMGSSGAGKTTLLNVIAQQNIRGLTVSGKTILNGHDYGRKVCDFSAYVQQDDVFFGVLTPTQHLTFHANLRGLGKRSDERVQEVIKEMGLTKCKDTQIGSEIRGFNLSGGERKRLSFATQVLIDIPLLFCDEPTSGLDSYLANSVIASLQKIASKGTTVLCTIHQPASETFAMFDNLLLLAKGRIAYMGGTREALDYFDKTLNCPCPMSYNPADHYVSKQKI